MVNGEQANPGKVSQAALARALDISAPMVTKLKKQGMPVESVEAARAWREKNLNIAQRKDVMTRPEGATATPSAFEPITVNGLRVFGQNPPPAPPPAPDDFGDDQDDGGALEDFKAAKTRLTVAEANLKELAEAKERRELIRVEAVKRQLATEYSTLREALMQIPARMAPLLAAEGDAAAIQTMLEVEVHQALVKLAGASDQVESFPGAFD